MGRYSQGLAVGAVLELVDLSMADVVVEVGEGALALDVTPPLAVGHGVAGAVEAKGRGQDNGQALADGNGKQLDVDIERQLRLAVLGRRRDSRHPVVLGLIALVDGEVVLEELRVAATGRHLVGSWW